MAYGSMLCLLLVSQKRECPLIQSGRQRHLILIAEFVWWFCLNEIDKIDSWRCSPRKLCQRKGQINSSDGEKCFLIDEQLQFCMVKLKSATPVMENPPKLYVFKSNQHTYDTANVMKKEKLMTRFKQPLL